MEGGVPDPPAATRYAHEGSHARRQPLACGGVLHLKWGFPRQPSKPSAEFLRAGNHGTRDDTETDGALRAGPTAHRELAD